MYKMQNPLPETLKRAVRGSVLKRVVPCLVAEMILVACLILWGDRLFPLKYAVARTSCHIAVILIPLFVTGVPMKLFDRSWRGTVQKVEIETTIDNASPIKPTRDYNYTKNTVNLAIVRDDGKWMYVKAYEGRAKFQQNLNKYKEGDEVFHLYGTNRIIVLSKGRDAQAECAFCGSMNGKESGHCHSCGCELIVK